MQNSWVIWMKHWTLLIWLTQLGLSVALPPVFFVLLGVWLRDKHGWGQWAVWVGIALGILLAVDGLLESIRAMGRMAKNQDRQSEQESPPVSFNDHE